jgi:hypothetical protein
MNRVIHKLLAMGKPEMWTILAWICAAAISLVALKYLNLPGPPYLWIFLVWSAALFVTAAWDRRRRSLWFNVACIGVGLGIFEYYLWTSGDKGFRARRVDDVDKRIHAPHGQLGWAPLAGTVATQRLFFEGELLYDATYNIAPNGLRVSSPAAVANNSAPECILFFGDSFTFGQGLEDHQTLPFQVHEKSMQQYRTYNFGVNGYGAHQMLAALQHGLVDDVVQCERSQVSHVFYQGITDHVRRSAGRLWWETHGPRYVLTEDGGVTLDGSFEDDDDYEEDRSWIEILGTQIFKSMIYQSIVQGRYVRKYSRDTIDLYVRIIDEARSVVRADFPSAEFHVLFWDEDNLDNGTVREGLRDRDITVHLMSDILPSYEPDDLNRVYRIHERDFHPNALANELIARYVVSQVLPSPGASVADERASPPLDGIGADSTSW